VSEQTYVIVGASLTGARAAEALRSAGFDGRVVLVGSEPERPYERPPLSKDYLRGEAEREVVYVHPADYYDEHAIELRLRTRAESLDLAASEVVLDGGERLRYDRLLLATGAEPVRLSIPGSDLARVHYLRTVDDCDVLREELGRGGKLVVIGAGWIGCEVAASARQLGLEVTVVAPGRVPLERVLGPELGAFYGELHREHGVELVMGTSVDAFEGTGTVEAVRTKEGRRIDCSAVLVGVGVTPRTGLAEAAGLAIDNGILVDELLQTATPGVFAAGDVANAFHPVYRRRLRVEHWANAREQGPVAGRNMFGAGAAYDRVPYFFSDQYDVGMEYAGYVREWDEVVIRGDADGREFIAFWLQDGRVAAGMNVNVWDVNEQIQALVRHAQPIDRDRLRDPEVPLEELVRVETGH
jgi:3-phenylpropionate/trans-cinnamate dioxygenase ferredoxin reductase component